MSKLTRALSAVAAVAIACVVAFSLGAPASATAPGNVTGIVSASGTPVAGIAVSWLVPNTGAFDTVETAADGSYTLPLPPGTGHYYLAVNAQAPYSSRVNAAYLALFFGQNNTEGYAYQALPAHSSRASYSLNVALETPGSVSGTSASLANSQISLEPVGFLYDSGPNADASGNFSFTGYTPGEYELYAPAHGAFAPYVSAPFDVEAGQTLDIDPTLSVGGTIEGTITAAIPMVGVTVTVSGGDISADDPMRTTPDGSGNYVLSGLGDGTYTVTVSNSMVGTVEDFVDATFMEHVILGETVTHDVTLVQAATLNLTVPTSSNPDESFEFCLYNSSGQLVDETSRVAGSFSLNNIAPGSYTLDVADDPATGYSSERITVTAGQSLTLPAPTLSTKAITVSGTITGGRSGVIEFGQTNGVSNFGNEASFGKSGKYSVTGLLPGKYDVYVLSSDRQRLHFTTTVTVSKAANYSIGSYLVHLNGTLDLEGAGIGSVDLYAFNSSPQQDELVMPVTNGKFEVIGQAGIYTLAPAIAIWNSSEDVFQDNSPFYFTWPPTLNTFKLTTGHTTNLGTVTLKVAGIG